MRVKRFELGRRSVVVGVVAGAVAMGSLVGGCASTPLSDAGTDAATDAVATGDAADASDGTSLMACTGVGTCPAGLECIGSTGCTGGGVMAACVMMQCSRTSAEYCGCDGVTFTARGGCPDRAYRHMGPCVGSGDAGSDR